METRCLPRMMSEPDSIVSQEAVAKDRFDELAEAVAALGSEILTFDQEVETWKGCVRSVKRAQPISMTPASAIEDAVAIAEAESETGATGETGENGEDFHGEAAGVALEEAPAGGDPDWVWYYASGRERVGPVGDRDLRRLLRTGRLPGATLVWTKGQDEWISAEKADLVEGKAKPETVPETEFRKVCLGCGIENRMGANFCRGCGHSLAGVEGVTRVRREACPSCEAPTAPEARFCRCCGARLRS